ncbi:hypothetical protein ABPG72_009401 [Tetrahymena utriculariae]
MNIGTNLGISNSQQSLLQSSNNVSSPILTSQAFPFMFQSATSLNQIPFNLNMNFPLPQILQMPSIDQINNNSSMLSQSDLQQLQQQQQQQNLFRQQNNFTGSSISQNELPSIQLQKSYSQNQIFTNEHQQQLQQQQQQFNYVQNQIKSLSQLIPDEDKQQQILKGQINENSNSNMMGKNFNKNCNTSGIVTPNRVVQQLKENLPTLLYMQQVIDQQIAYHKYYIQQANLQQQQQANIQIDPFLPSFGQNIPQYNPLNSNSSSQVSSQSQINANTNLNSLEISPANQKSSIKNVSNVNQIQVKQQQNDQNQFNLLQESPNQPFSLNEQLNMNPSIQEKLLKRQKVAEELSELMHFLINNMTVLSTDKIFERKKDIKYLNEKESQIYDQIVNKYQYSKKTKEEMIKFILRKCFKFLKSDMKQFDLSQQREMDKAFFDKYFDSADFCTDDQFMPFKKKSSLKTMNSQFLKKIFKSPSFSQGYHQYLDKFEEISVKENEKKVKKFVNYILDLMDKNKLDKMKSFKRLPWLKIWLKDTHEIAKSLLIYEEQTSQQRSQEISFSNLKKKQKTEDDEQNAISKFSSNVGKKSEVIKIETDEGIQQSFQSNSDKNFKSPISQPITQIIMTNNQYPLNPLNLSSSVMISSRQGLNDDTSLQDTH